MVTHLSPNFDYHRAEYEELACNFCGRRDWRVLARRDANRLAVETRLCLYCGLIAVNPRMTRDWYGRYYEMEYRRERARAKGRPDAGAADLKQLFEKGERFGRALARLVRSSVRPGFTVEVGSSAGGVLAAFAAEIPNIRPFGIEPSTLEAEYAESRGVPTRVGLFENFAEQLEPAANIICVRTLNHLLDPRRFLEWAHSALEPGGKLILAVLDFQHSCMKRGTPERAIQIDHVFMYSPEVLEAFVTAAGFDIELSDVPARLPLREFFKLRERGLTGQHMRLVLRRAERKPFADLSPVAGLGERVSAAFSRPRFFAYSLCFRAYRFLRRVPRIPGKIIRFGIRIARAPIIWILLAALALRLFGIGYGFPLFLVNDEPALVLGALKMLELKTLVPAWHEAEFKTVLYYSPFVPYFYLAVLSPVIALNYLASGMPPLADYKDAITLDPSFIWIAARFFNMFLGVSLIYVAYRIARRVTASERAALFTALFLALSFYHIQLSHVVRHWMPAALLVYATWLASFGIRGGGGRKAYLATGILAGVGTAINTSAAIALLPAGFAHLGRLPAGQAGSGASVARKIFSANAWLMAALATAIVGASVALYPYGFTRAEGAASVAGDISMRLGFLATRSVGEWARLLYDYGTLLFRYETGLALFALIGGALLFRRDRLFVATVFLFSFAYLTLLYLFFSKIPRALIFLLPAFAVLAGYGLDRALKWLRGRFGGHSFAAVFLEIALFGALFAYPLAVALQYGYLAAQPDTRLVAKSWIEANLPAGTKVLMDTQYLRLTNTKKGITDLAAIAPSGLRSQDRVLLSRDDARYPVPAHYVLNLHFLTPDRTERTIGDPAFFRARGFRYLIVEYEDADRSDLEPSTRALLQNLRLVKRFTPFRNQELPFGIDLSGEIASVPPSTLFRLSRFGEIVDVYEF